MTKTATASFDAPRRGYSFLMETEDEGMATYLQKRTLTDLIYQHIDEEQREGCLQQLSDITKTEADDWILEFTMGRW